MQVVSSDKVIFFDVDETLVQEHPGASLEVVCEGHKTLVKPLLENINRIHYHKARGQTIVVWSNSGYKWALAVVEALGLTKQVDLVISKPWCYYDDLDSSKWLGQPRWGNKPR